MFITREARLPRSGIAKPSITPSAISQKISLKVLERISRYDMLIMRVAAEEQFDPNWIRGVIAAESGGKPRKGKGTTGFKGLMQAERTNDQLDPEVSIRTGVRKLKRFRASVFRFLRKKGIDPRSLGMETVIRLTMVAYNAGPGTLKRAMRYAIAAGDVRRWMEREHFQRALIYYGAYSVRVALGSCLRGPDGSVIQQELAKLLGISMGDFRGRFFRSSRGWNQNKIWNATRRALQAGKRKWKRRVGLTLAQARRKAPRWLLCSVQFKHNNLRTWYVDRVIAYMRYYKQARPSSR